MADETPDLMLLRQSYVLSLIEQNVDLQAEVARLCAAGDELAAAAIRTQWSRIAVAVAAWQEARRG